MKSNGTDSNGFCWPDSETADLAMLASWDVSMHAVFVSISHAGLATAELAPRHAALNSSRWGDFEEMESTDNSLLCFRINEDNVVNKSALFRDRLTL